MFCHQQFPYKGKRVSIVRRPTSPLIPSPEERTLRRCKLAAVVAAGEQVAVGVRRHLDRGVTESGLHQLERQFEPAVDAAVDAPRGVEVAEPVQALVFRTAVPIDDAGGDLRWMEAVLDDCVAML